MSREYEPHELRVIEEQDALAHRLSKLVTFLDSAMFASLPELDRDLLIQQTHHMTEYIAVLAKRIQRFA